MLHVIPLTKGGFASGNAFAALLKELSMFGWQTKLLHVLTQILPDRLHDLELLSQRELADVGNTHNG